MIIDIPWWYMCEAQSGIPCRCWTRRKQCERNTATVLTNKPGGFFFLNRAKLGWGVGGGGGGVRYSICNVLQKYKVNLHCKALYLFICLFTHWHIHRHTHAHTSHTHACMHTYTHTHTHTHSASPSLSWSSSLPPSLPLCVSLVVMHNLGPSFVLTLLKSF